MLFFLLISILSLISACDSQSTGSIKPGNQAGTCPLNCGKAMIASNDTNISILPVFEELNVLCTNAGSAVTMDIQYIIREEYTKIIEGEKKLFYRPVPLTSIRVMAVGLDTTSELVTQQDLLCSDSCGVAAVQINPTCPAAGDKREMALSIGSGALVSPPIVIKLEND